MNATILSIANNGNSSLSVWASFVDDNGNPINYNNLVWAGVPAIQFVFPIPTSSPTFTADLATTIANTIQTRLNSEFTNWIGNNVTSAAINYLTPLLVNTTFSQVTSTIGGTVLSASNGAASISAIAQTVSLGGPVVSTATVTS